MANLSARYATALFELAEENNSIDSTLEQALFMYDTLKDKECLQTLKHPRLLPKEKCAFFSEVFSEHISDDLMGILHLVINKNREDYLLPALLMLVDMINEYRKKTKAVITAAVPLSEAQVSKLQALLEQKLNKKVEIIQKIDTSIIGGMAVRVDGFITDLTVKKQLHDMKDMLQAAI